MNQGNLICFFLILFCIGLPTQVLLESKEHSESYLKSSEQQEHGQTSLKPRILIVESTETTEHLSTDIFQLCGIKTSPGKMIRCNDENSLPLCLNEIAGNVTMCHHTPLLLRKPLCVKHFLELQRVVSCTDTSSHVCYTSDAKAGRLEFCKQSAAAVCLEPRSEDFQLCSAERIKRQEVQVQEPELDLDGYYLKCKDCDLKVAMKVDEEHNEKPVIVILSEPRKKSKEQSTKKTPTTKKSNKEQSTKKTPTTKKSNKEQSTKKTPTTKATG